MGWFFRRSAKLGPFRLNFSKSGIGVSAGVRGARVSAGPRGTYVNLGTHGIYYRHKIGERYSTGSAAGMPWSNTNTVPNQTVPPNLRYPIFPKHGPPRIVTTLGILSIPVLVVLIWIVALMAASSSSTSPNKSTANDNSNTQTNDNPLQTNRAQGFNGGFDYAVRVSGGRKLDQRRLKQLAAQMAAKEQLDQEWQQGWIEGYTRGSDRSIGYNANDKRAQRDQRAPRETIPPTIPKLRPASNGYIRGPRGGCYYLSSSGRRGVRQIEYCVTSDFTFAAIILSGC